MRSSFSLSLLYHAYVYLEFLILACTIYILAPSYEFLAYDNLANYKIPVPDYEVQKSIVGIYNVYNERREINEKLKAQIKDICPILIKGSIEEARKAKEA